VKALSDLHENEAFMAEELQHLIERIQREAVDIGEKQAAEILAKAKQQAAQIIAEAEKKAQARIEAAEKEAEQFTERSIKALQQAARDLLITVGQGVENIISNLAAEAAEGSLTYETVQEMLVKLAENYVGRSDRERRIELMVSPQDQARLINFFKDRYHDKLQQGIVIQGDERIFKGFKVQLQDGRVTHNFTSEAIAEALSNFLRPHLAEIVYKVAREGGAT
jgi:V/A-type H+-transporting ATPase subunit E